MEAFIITDKVIAKQHMLDTSSRPKYIKKYDVSSTTVHIRKMTHVHHKPFIKTIPLNAPRTKELLLQISQPLFKKNSRLSTPQLDKYFTLASEGSRQILKKDKRSLLVKKFQPHSQQYDADFRPVSRRAPSWILIGKKGSPGTAIVRSQQKQFFNQNAFGISGRVSGPSQLGQLLQRQQQRFQDSAKGIQGQLFEPKLYYSPSDLGRCTTSIFKKYNLDKDPYFKKFLSDIQNETS